MKSLKNEQFLLYLIKYGAIIPIILFSLIMTYIIIDEKNIEFENNIYTLKDRYIKENKAYVENEVLRVVNSITYEILKSNKNLKAFLKDKVYEAHSIATNIYKQEKDAPKNHQLEMIKHALSGMIYNGGRGYIFINSFDGTNILQPLDKSLEGKNLKDFEDAKGYKFINKITETISKKSEAFDTYYWYKSLDDSKAYKKISFYKYFEPLNFAIGTGEYLDEFENKIKITLLNKINNIRFKENGYIFIFNKKGDYLAHFKKELVGTNGLKTLDKNGEPFIQGIIDFAVKNGSGFHTYFASIRPNASNVNSQKTSYIYYDKKLDWIIGAGFYLDELNEQITSQSNLLKKEYERVINKIIIISIFITILLLVLSTYLSKIVEKKFKSYKEELEVSLKEGLEKEKLLIQQSKMALMGEMIANIAHQWKQPLGIIRGSNSLIKFDREFENFSSPHKVDNAIEKIEESVVYLSTTIDDFRNFFNPNKEQIKFSILNMFDKVFKIVSSQLSNNDIEIVKNINDIEVKTFQNELIHVLMNLLKNSKDELLEVSYLERYIFIDVFKKSDNLIIKIKDSAGGIKNENYEKIFEAYYTTKADKEGTGIGLYMSKKIIENMGGEIDVINKEFEYDGKNLKGAEFTISLPIINKN